MLGTRIHLAAIALPDVELFVSGSIVVFGGLLAFRTPPRASIILPLVGLASIFHGYAYGETIFGAERTPLLAYLLGFTLIQLIIALGVYSVGLQFFQRSGQG
jgi:urease accessory protein